MHTVILPYHSGKTAQLPGAEAAVWAQCAAPIKQLVIGTSWRYHEPCIHLLLVIFSSAGDKL